MEPCPLITISIVVFNRVDLTKKALSLVMDKTRIPFLVWVVDNASTDGTQDYMTELAESDPRVRYTRNQKNLGCPGGNNIVSSQFTTPYLGLMNTDVDFSDDIFGVMVKFLECNPSIAQVTPSANKWCLNPNFVGYPCPPGRQPDYLEASMCVLPRWAISLLGGNVFNPRIFLYGEDSDLSLNLRRMGYSLGTVDVPFRHFGGGTVSQLGTNLSSVMSTSLSLLSIKHKKYFEHHGFSWTIVVTCTGSERVLAFLPVLRAIKLWNPATKIHCVTDSSECLGDAISLVSLVSPNETDLTTVPSDWTLTLDFVPLGTRVEDATLAYLRMVQGVLDPDIHL